MPLPPILRPSYLLCFLICPLLIIGSALMHSIMRFSTPTILILSGVHQAYSECQTVDPSSVDLSWHAPNATKVNSLATVINGTGISGFVFNSSTDPAGVSYGTYNWCNMPHVRPQNYVKAPAAYKLEYVELIHRHHKRTPYASNTFPHESYSWYCNDEALFYYGVPYPDGASAQINWNVYTSPSNPFTPEGFKGTCQFPQISAGGLNDSRQHGKDLWGVYYNLLGFLPANYSASKVVYRVTNNVITSQVAGQIVDGMYPGIARNEPFPVLIQPDSIDSLEPTYSCSAASSDYSSYGVGSTNPAWTAHLNQSVSLFARLDAVSGVNSSDPDWHQWFDHYFDNLSARLCHAKPLPCNATNSLCVSQEDADAVFRRGEYEYSFIYRDANQSLAASTASYGVWVAELASNIRAVMNGDSEVLYRHNVAHDGSMSRLLSILQVDVMVWPGMGSEVVFELYSRSGCYFLRVLWGGQVLRSSNPSLGLLNLVPVQTFLAYIDGLVGEMAIKVPDLCS